MLYMDCICMCAVFSLGVGHRGVLDEGEVVGDVLVVRQPPMGPDQAVLTHRQLETEQTPQRRHCQSHIKLKGNTLSFLIFFPSFTTNFNVYRKNH